MSYLQFTDENVRQTLVNAAEQMDDTTPLAASLERVLVSQSLQNFHANGRPAWAGLSPVTLEIYRRKGIVPQGILQRTAGGLRDSVQGDHDRDSATVGAGSGKSKDYAAIHQWGGFAGRNRKVEIKPRSYLPMDSQGFLQPEAEVVVEYTANYFLSQAFK